MLTASKCVVGGGIIGLLAAWYLANRRHSVVVVDPVCPDLRGASLAAGGILSPLHPEELKHLSPLVSMSQAEYPNLVAQVETKSQVNIELRKTRLILLDDVIPAPPGGRVGPRELRAMEPSLRAPHVATVYDTHHLRSPRLVKALRIALANQGVVFLDRRVNGFVMGKQGIAVLTAEGDSIFADACLVAAGAWTGRLLRSTGLDVAIKPMRGQMLAVRALPSLVHNVIVCGHRYLVPRMDGLVLVGSTVEDVGFEHRITEIAYKELWDFATGVVPDLGKYRIEHHWAGLRPGSPDDLPFVGEHPDIKGLVVCAGHFRNGFATGPATARIAVDIMLGNKPSVDASPYRLDRPCPPWSKAKQWT